MLYWWPIWYTTWDNIFLSILAILVIIIFWWVLYSFIWSAFMFVFSRWDENKIKQAINSVRYSIIWLILIILLLFIFPIIFQKLQIPGYKVYTAKNIFKRATFIIKNLFIWLKKSWINSINDKDEDFDTSL